MISKAAVADQARPIIEAFTRAVIELLHRQTADAVERARVAARERFIAELDDDAGDEPVEPKTRKPHKVKRAAAPLNEPTKPVKPKTIAAKASPRAKAKGVGRGHGSPSCGKCGQQGHNARTCAKQAAADDDDSEDESAAPVPPAPPARPVSPERIAVVEVQPPPPSWLRRLPAASPTEPTRRDRGLCRRSSRARAGRCSLAQLGPAQATQARARAACLRQPVSRSQLRNRARARRTRRCLVTTRSLPT